MGVLYWKCNVRALLVKYEGCKDYFATATVPPFLFFGPYGITLNKKVYTDNKVTTVHYHDLSNCSC